MTGKKFVLCAGVVLGLLLTGAGVRAAVVPPSIEESTAELPRIWETEDGRVVVEDGTHHFRIELPGAYWELKTPGQIRREQGGATRGCGPRQKVAPSLMLVARNKDAAVSAVRMDMQPERFSMRGRQDLESYIEKRQQLIMERGKGAIEVENPSIEQDGGMIVHQATFTATGRQGKQKFIQVDYFVRPEGKMARLYQLACISSADEYPQLKPDFDQIIKSFRYTGELAEGFFQPDAAPEQLPSPEQGLEGQKRCGGGYSGMLVAVVGVFVIYMIMRRRKQSESPRV